MASHDSLSGELSDPIRIFNISGKQAQLKILHVGVLSTSMKFYLIRNNIQNYPIVTPQSDYDIDMILVNGEETDYKSISKTLVNIRPVVRYIHSKYADPKKEVIPFVLIPILVKYLIKLKESLNTMSRRLAFDTADRFLHRLTATIDEHLDDHTMSIKKLSNLVFMSRSAFTKKVKEFTGLKPTEFINQYKVEKSKHLLSVTNWQIGRISDQLGFCSQQYYCRLFKKMEGVNPSEFRKNYRNSGAI